MNCLSAGCRKRGHQASWTMFPDWCPTPVCDSVKQKLQADGLPESDFHPIEMKKVTKEVYEAFDGKVFDNEEDCLSYEKKNQIGALYCLVYGPDLTEGRGYSRSLYIGITANGTHWGDHLMAAEYIAYVLCGSPVDFVQGCSPMRNYTLTKVEDLSKWLSFPETRLGDYTNVGGRLLVDKPIHPNIKKADVEANIIKPK